MKRFALCLLLLAAPAFAESPRTLWTNWQDALTQAAAIAPAEKRSGRWAIAERQIKTDDGTLVYRWQGSKKDDPPAPLTLTIPAEVEADAENLDAFIPLTTNAKVLAWRIPKASGIRVLPQYDPGSMLPREFYLVRCKKQGEWEFIVTGTDGSGKLAQVVCLVKVGTVPPPVPPVPPVPPNDPFVQALQVAFAGDSDPARAQQKANLAALYRQGATTATDPSLGTWGALFDVLAAAARTLGVAGKLVPVQRVIQGELQKVLPSNPAAPLDAAGRDLAGKVFTRVANSLEAVK